MDSWSAEQLKKMQMGGNKKMNEFFKEYGVSKNTDIVTKYNSRAAEVIRHAHHTYAPPVEAHSSCPLCPAPHATHAPLSQSGGRR
jgi:hypothetical protein